MGSALLLVGLGFAILAFMAFRWLPAKEAAGHAPPRRRSGPRRRRHDARTIQASGNGPAIAGPFPAGAGKRGYKADVPLSAAELSLIDAYWRAANYLSVGQIYLLDNPLLREPLKPEHVKPHSSATSAPPRA